MAINVEETLLELSKTCAAIQQGQTDMHNRLFVDGGGILPILYQKTSAVEKALEEKADVSTVTELGKTVGDIKEKHAYHLGFASGIGAAATFALKYAAGKMGIHLP